MGFLFRLGASPRAAARANNVGERSIRSLRGASRDVVDVDCDWSSTMIFGSHVILYSNDAVADRDFFRDVLGFSSVDAGNGWLIFAVPPAEVAVHPTDEPASAAL